MQVKLLKTLTGHNAAIYAIQPHRTQLLTGGGEGFIAEWQPLESSDAQLIAQAPESIFCLCRAGKFLLAGGINGNLYVIDYAEKTILKNIIHHKKGLFSIFYLSKKEQKNDNTVNNSVSLAENVNNLGISNENSFFENDELITAGGDGRLSFWDINTWQPLETLALSAKSLRCLSFEKNGQKNERTRHRLLAVGDSQGNITIIDIFTKKIEKHLKNAHLPSVFSVQFSPCGNYLYSGGRDALLKIWEINNDFCLRKTIPAHNFTINDIQFSPNGSFFATASRDKTIKIWETKTQNLLKVLDLFRFGLHKNSVNKLHWQSDEILISVSDDRSIGVWEISFF